MALDPRKLADLTFSIGISSWLRIFPAAHLETPLGTGSGASRFRAAAAPYRLIYLARDLSTALAEGLLRDRFEAVPERLIDIAEVQSKAAAEISATLPINALDVRGSGLFRLGVDTDARGARAHRAGQALGMDLWSAGDVDGVLYPSRLTGGDCLALFDRIIGSHLTCRAAARLDRVAELPEALAALNVRLVKS